MLHGLSREPEEIVAICQRGVGPERDISIERGPQRRSRPPQILHRHGRLLVRRLKSHCCSLTFQLNNAGVGGLPSGANLSRIGGPEHLYRPMIVYPTEPTDKIGQSTPLPRPS
ncbi:MAG: hypothetical protein OEW29_12695, partial [Acidimicrobiia bacterium]|nr:hypothetical protein [Acidimicrobiia bacterium]